MPATLSKIEEFSLKENFYCLYGKIKSVRKDAVRFSFPGVQVGSLCEVRRGNMECVLEVVSLDPRGNVGMPLDERDFLQLRDPIFLREQEPSVAVGESLLGRVIDSLCAPYDGKGELYLPDEVPLYGEKNNPLERKIIEKPLDLGVRSINTFLTCGLGQRQGIFAGSGVGKSVLLGMMTKFTAADLVVVCLLGERGREVNEFIEQELGKEALKKTILVVETSDKSAIRRSRCAYTATAIAEYFRKKKKNVLLLMDSLTRFAMAAREVGLASGEPPTTKGYTPSVFSKMASLIERAGSWGEEGSITGLYTVLVEGDDFSDPVCDSARSFLDGHIVLSRKFANQGFFPAIDLTASVSRVMDKIVSKEHDEESRKVREILARYEQNEDAIRYGMYAIGTNPRIDECIHLEPGIRNLIRQDKMEKVDFQTGREQLHLLLQK